MRILRRLRYWRDRDARAQSLQDEMQSHLAFRIDELVEQGLTEAAARAQARKEMGNMTLMAEEARSVWIARWMTDLVQDVRYAMRGLMKEKGFAAVAILSAALGIGGCATIFGVATFAVSQPLPVADPDRLVAISGTRLDSGDRGDSVSMPQWMDVRTGAKSLDGVTAYLPMMAGAFATAAEPVRAWGAIVTANYFDVVRPGFILGRGFDPQDDNKGAPPAIVLSHALWTSRFGADPAVVGRRVAFNGRPVEIRGVAAQSFRGVDLGLVNEFWAPMSMLGDIQKGRAADDRDSRSHHWLLLAGRVRDGYSIEQARSEVEGIGRRNAKQIPEHKNEGFHLERAGMLNPGMRRALDAFLVLVIVVTLMVLTIACANVANLLLARASSRQRELATRLAIGAARGRLMRQMLTESLLLAAFGSIGGVLIASASATSLGKVNLPVPIPLDLSISLDYRVLIFALGLSVVTGLLFGLVPAWRATRMPLSGAMKDDAQIAGMRRFGLRNVLVVAQVAVSLILLVCSGLFVRSLSTARSMDLGMETRNALMLSFDPLLQGYDVPRTTAFLRTVLRDASQLAGVESAALTNIVPLSLGGSSSVVNAEGGSNAAARVPSDIFCVSPSYFATLGIAMRQGADFDLASRSEVVIINEALAKKLFPNGDAVGRRLRLDDRAFEVIGVAANASSRTIGEEQRNALYMPLLANIAREDSMMGVSLILRTTGAPAALTAVATELIHKLDPAMAVSNVKTIETHLHEALFLPRLAAYIFGSLGAMGLLIATIGIYGVVSFSVARRTREVGIRMALGASRGQTLRMVLREGLMLAGIGSAIGLVAAFLASRAAQAFLLGVSSRDLITFIGVPVFLLGVAALATLIPARRAAALDPMHALRYD